MKNRRVDGRLICKVVVVMILNEQRVVAFERDILNIIKVMRFRHLQGEVTVQ